MTTVYVNLIKGVVYTDSRKTSTQSYDFTLFGFKFVKSEEKILGFSLSRKVYPIHNCAVVTVGDVEVSEHLKSLFLEGFNPANHVVPETLKGLIGKILIVRPGYTISITIKNGVIERKTFISDNLTTGSGSEVGFLSSAQGYLWTLTKEQVIKVLRLNSLFDTYSDDNIVCVSPEDYRGNNVDL